MKTFIFTLCSLLFFLTTPLAATGLGFMPECVLQVFGIGYRNDDIRWKANDFPERFKIDDAHIAKINVGLEATLFDFVLFRAEGDCGIVFEGRRKLNSSDSYYSNFYYYYNFPYDSDSRGHHVKLRGNYIYDYSLCFGLDVNALCPFINVFPLIGYSYHFQKYHLGHQDSYYNFIDFEPEHYKATWQGLWAGLNLGLDLPDGINFSIEYQYHRASFHGKFDLDDESYSSYHGSFHRSSYGNGNIAKANLSCSFCDGWRTKIEAVIQFWSAKKVTWNSYEFNVTTGYQF